MIERPLLVSRANGRFVRSRDLHFLSSKVRFQAEAMFASTAELGRLCENLTLEVADRKPFQEHFEYAVFARSYVSLGHPTGFLPPGNPAPDAGR
jgi:hypothetical protein